MTETDDFQPVTDPALMEQIAREIETPSEPVRSKVAPVDTHEPARLPDTTVRLPGGYRYKGELFTEAEVRELNGLDEEAVARQTGVGKALLTVLERAVVSVGDLPATRQLLDEMLSGDREALLLGIAKATFGATHEFDQLQCPHCSETFDATVDLNKVEVRTVEPDETRWEVSLSKGRVAVVGLPIGTTQKKLTTATDKTSAELNTILLQDCVKEIDELPIVSPRQVQELSVKDRDLILREIADRNPGPRLQDTTVTCTACGEGVALPLTLAALFRL